LAPAEGTERLYGRRRGHRLRKGQEALVAGLLPALRVALPLAGGVLDPRALFPRPVREVWLEIGFGAGEHLEAQARARPDVGLIGCEPFLNGVASLLARVAADAAFLAQGNLRLLDGDVRPLLDRLATGSLARVVALFPDPWPKKRHHKRRLVGPANLERFARVLADGGELRFASDDMGYVRWALAHLAGHPAFAWTARRPGDWRERPADGVETRYEAKARRQGRRPVHLSFRRRPRA
jgi:tRNA (guanine-N7-)-methyltransferase